jgi:hypothetical protein
VITYSSKSRGSLAPARDRGAADSVSGRANFYILCGWIASFRSLANQAAQVSLVSGDATGHEDSVLSVDVDDVDAAYALAQATGMLPDYDKCQACIADVHSAFRSGS